jgi:hypothetical protein
MLRLETRRGDDTSSRKLGLPSEAAGFQPFRAPTLRLEPDHPLLGTVQTRRLAVELRMYTQSKLRYKSSNVDGVVCRF